MTKTFLKTLCLSLLALVAGSAWAQNVAKVGTTEYATIEEALAAWGPGKTLTLLDNVTTTSTFTVEVNATKSTSNWIIQLGDYTWTASSCDAIKLYAAGGTVMNQNYGMKIYANENGGIKATNKNVIKCSYDTSTAGYRPRLEIHGGQYTGSVIVNYANLTWNNTSISNGPSTWFYAGEDGKAPVFNGNMYLAKCPIYVYSGVFNGSTFNTYQVTSTALTNIYGGKFKAIPSNSNTKTGYFDDGKAFYYTSDGYYEYKSTSNAKEASVNATTVNSILSSTYGYNAGVVYFEDADYAINKYTAVNLYTSSAQNKTVSSGTFTLDATNENASYSGTVTLSGSTAKFIIKVKDVNANQATVVCSSTLKGVKTDITTDETTGITTYTYTALSTPLTDGNAMIGTTYYANVFDAFCAADGTTDKTIKQIKDETTASIKASSNTEVIYDLNGCTFGLKSLAIGSGVNATMTIVDNSEAKTGKVTNTLDSFTLIGLLGYLSGDIAADGTYNLIVKAGTWQFNPEAFEMNGETFDLVPDGYTVTDNGDGTYTVKEVLPVIIPEVEKELVITTDEQQTIPDEKKEEVAAAVVAVFTQNSSVNNMSAEETNINDAVSGEGERRLKVELISAVVDVETITSQTSTTKTTVKGAKCEVKPVYVDENGQTVIINNEDIKAPITFRLAVQKDIQDDCAKVWHQAVVYDQDGKASADPNSTEEYLGVFPIQTAANGEKYIELSASKFSFYNYLTQSMEQMTVVAQIGDVKYETLAEAVNAAEAGDVVEILIADTYTLPNLPKNITIKGAVDNVVFNCEGTGSIASVPNGATFENVTMNFGQINYHGFQHAGTINMNGCTLNGLFFSYGDMNFTDCTFNQTTGEYMMWDYGKDLTYTNCVFNGHGKYINVYNEGNGNWSLTVKGCKFVNDGAANKAALNIKETCGSTLLGWNVVIDDTNKLEGNFPANSETDTKVVGGNGLWQVDDRTSDHTKSLVFVKDTEDTILYEATKAAPVAKIDDVEYASLAEAIAAVPTNGTETTITMIADVTGADGISVASGKNFTVDFDGHTYTLGGDGAGSAGTQTQGFQLLQGSTITFKNGTIKCAEKNKDRIWQASDSSKGIAMLIQNYANLTLDGMTIDGENIAHNGATTRYVVSNNSGDVNFTGATTITAADGDFAFDVYKYGTYPVPTVTINSKNVTITGNIEATGGKLNISAGTVTGTISTGTGYTKGDIAISGGSFSNPVAAEYCAKGFQPVTDEQGKYTVEKSPVAQIGTTKYTSLAEAVAAVPTNGTEMTITMLANEAIDVAGTGLTVAKNQNIVLDLNGFEIAGVCSTGTGSDLIVNKGGLTIKDCSTEGTGKMTYGANPTWIYDGGDDYSGSYASNLITNKGTLTIESGYFENAGTGSACYAIDNNSTVDNAILTVNGGTIKGKSTAVRQYCNSPAKDNTVNVNGGTIEGGYAGIWIQLPGSGQAKKAALNVTGGTLKGTYAFYDYTYGDVYDAVQYNLSGGTFDGYIFSFGANMTITDGTYSGEIDIEQTQPSRLSVTGGKFSGDICAYGDNASTGFISGGVYKDYTFEYEQQTYGCYWFYSIDPRYEAIYNTAEATKEEYPYTVGLKEQIIIPEVEETLDITTDDEQQTIPDDKKEEVAAAVVAALTQNSSVNNMTAEETNINNAVPVSETQVDSERRLKVELTSAVVAAETITEQTTTTTTTVKGATFEVKPVYVYEEGGVTKTEIVRNEDIKAPITFRLAVQKNIQDDCAKVWHQAVVYDQDGKASADPNSPKEYLGVFPIQTADNGEKYIQLSASKFSFYNYLTKSMEQMTFVAQIGDAKYETLAEAIAAVKDGETITMIADVTGANGISVESGKNFTVDFANHIYTLGGDGAGSTNTKTSGFQLLEGSTITFKNGTINCAEENKDRTWTTGSSEPKGIAMLIQNYANLTLDGMTIDGSNIAHNGAATRYVVSNNCGNVRYTGATTITAATGDKAFDVYKFGTYDAPTITIDDAQVTINGNIEAAGGKLNISAGTVNGTISTGTGYTEGDIAISGGSFSEKVKDEYCATGFQPVTEKDEQGKYTVKVKDVVLTVYANSTVAEEMNIPAFLAAQQTYPNAMAVVSATYSEDVKGLDNVILDYPVGKGGHYYECDNFVLTDKEYWYSPVDFMAVEGAYERTNTGGMNSVCLPFDMTKTDVNGGVFGTFHSTSISSAIGGEATGVAYFREVNEIKAGTPCLVKCESDEAWEIDLAGRYIVSAIDQSSAIQGSYMKKTIGTGFFKVSSDGAGFSTTTASSTVTPFRTYLDLTYQSSIGGDESNVQSFNIIFKEEVTGISTTSVQNENQTFDLNGRMQNSLQKGVNVVRAQNGYKKILK